MRWKRETRQARRDRQDSEHFAWIKLVSEWHRTFAWRPRYTEDGGICMWMEFVLTRRVSGGHWQYRPITILETDILPRR
jgi:hypothetical protein